MKLIDYFYNLDINDGITILFIAIIIFGISLALYFNDNRPY